ncbi:MAG TPA: outer membrane lipid asymmetry maintenance protein MlaD [Candidatus Omnitrophota bacterium]|nr:outer membrane lipid asymmetry maintenance protein MlaD [Candidatus Omnitrophota bacterium]
MVTKGGWRDTITGAIVVSVAAVMLSLVYVKDSSPGADSQAGYLVTARFNRADGVGVGTTVRMSGVPVGKVVAQSLDPQFRAVATLQVESTVQLTADTAAAILTDGLLGAKYIELQPGADEAVLKPGSEIAFTQDAMVIEELLDKIIQQGRAKRGWLDKPLPTAN